MDQNQEIIQAFWKGFNKSAQLRGTVGDIFQKDFNLTSGDDDSVLPELGDFEFDLSFDGSSE